MAKYNFDNRRALLDTNIVGEFIDQSKRSALKFKPVFEFLKRKRVNPFVLNATIFEFVGYSTHKQVYDERQKLIKRLPVSKVTAADMEMAQYLSSVYKFISAEISPKQISYVDCLHAAQLVRLKEEAFIVTTDVNDYPSFLFDISHVIPISTDGGKTTFVTFKTYNDQKWNDICARFDSSGGRPVAGAVPVTNV
jgi:hypothetical protein